MEESCGGVIADNKKIWLDSCLWGWKPQRVEMKVSGIKECKLGCLMGSL